MDSFFYLKIKSTYNINRMATIANTITLKETYFNIDAIDLFLSIDTENPNYDKELMMWPT